jgi:hypothetical protein
MIALPETTKIAIVLSVHGDNGVWKKPKRRGNKKAGPLKKLAASCGECNDRRHQWKISNRNNT